MSRRRKPSEIRFSQDSIKNHWKDNSCQIGETLDQLLKGEIIVDDIEKITVNIKNGNLYSADNRRLWVFQKLEKLGKCDTIAVKFEHIDSRKFTTTNLGASVRIRGSGDPGGRFWKSLEKDNVCSTFTGGINNQSGLETSCSPRADEWTDTTFTSAFENTIRIDKMEQNICLNDIGYFQTDSIIDGEHLGELLDDWLQLDCSKVYWILDIFKRFGSYYTTENEQLWVLKNLEKFSKSPEIKFTFTEPPFKEMSATHTLRDSLKLGPSALIGGSVWKNIDYLKKLPTFEVVKSSVRDIYFTKTTIPDTYENESLAKVLADSYASLTLPRCIRVVKFGEKYYALDNEILLITKKIERVRGPLELSVEVKIEMDSPLFRGFLSKNIQDVTIQKTTFSHTNEESFIFECMKKMPTT